MSPQPTSSRFTKHYRGADTCQAALANYRWLAHLGAPIQQPRLLSAAEHRLEFEFVHGRLVRPGDLVELAAHLGEVHGHAHAAELHRARLDRPHVGGDGHVIPDFLTPRLPVLRHCLHSGTVPSPQFSTAGATALLRAACTGPAALYKDANPRNVLLTPGSIVTLDTDDLTLAPFGYDLAKLVVTLAMTHGVLPPEVIDDARAAYNHAVNHYRPGLGDVGWSELLAWAEIHHALTGPYLGRGGYRYSWHTLRPTRHAQRLSPGAASWLSSPS